MFNRGEPVLIDCSLSRSGFSSERIFRVNQANQTEHIGAAPVHYCLTKEGLKLDADSPAKDQRIPGLVQGYVISNGGMQARIETPDGETVEVDTSIVFRLADVSSQKRQNDVPV